MNCMKLNHEQFFLYAHYNKITLLINIANIESMNTVTESRD